jgi:hypothetical protein
MLTGKFNLISTIGFNYWCVHWNRTNAWGCSIQHYEPPLSEYKYKKALPVISSISHFEQIILTMSDFFRFDIWDFWRTGSGKKWRNDGKWRNFAKQRFKHHVRGRAKGTVQTYRKFGTRVKGTIRKITSARI